ncbi:hypothetical protein CEXT_684381, partial [Caerostris extrusa]
MSLAKIKLFQLVCSPSQRQSLVLAEFNAAARVYFFDQQALSDCPRKELAPERHN